MEQEEDYKVIQFKITDLNETLQSLNEFNVEKMKSDANKDIEEHFDSLIKALQDKKKVLIDSVHQLSVELQQEIETEKKDLQTKIEITNKILDSGVAIYSLQPDVAASIWKASCKITNQKKQMMRVKVELPSLLDSFLSYSKVVMEATSKELPQPQYIASEVSTLAGTTEGYNDGQGTDAQFNGPWGVVLNPVDDCLYVCDYHNHSIRKVTKSGHVSTFTKCQEPVGIAFHQKERCFFVVEYCNHSIKKISLTGETSTLAGCRKRGHQDGEGEKRMFNFPCGITVNEDNGDIYVADSNNHVIQKITLQGIVSTFAGKPNQRGFADGDAKSALFGYPRGICFHPQQQALFVCDTDNNRIRKVSLDGNTTSFCEIKRPMSVCALSSCSILVNSISQIFKVTFDRNDGKPEVELFAGSGEQGHKDGLPQKSHFNKPRGLAIDSNTNTCFVTDNNKIRAIKYN